MLNWFINAKLEQSVRLSFFVLKSPEDILGFFLHILCNSEEINVAFIYFIRKRYLSWWVERAVSKQSFAMAIILSRVLSFDEACSFSDGNTILVFVSSLMSIFSRGLKTPSSNTFSISFCIFNYFIVKGNGAGSLKPINSERFRIFLTFFNCFYHSVKFWHLLIDKQEMCQTGRIENKISKSRDMTLT